MKPVYNVFGERVVHLLVGDSDIAFAFGHNIEPGIMMSKPRMGRGKTEPKVGALSGILYTPVVEWVGLPPSRYI